MGKGFLNNKCVNYLWIKQTVISNPFFSGTTWPRTKTPEGNFTGKVLKRCYKCR